MQAHPTCRHTQHAVTPNMQSHPTCSHAQSTQQRHPLILIEICFETKEMETDITKETEILAIMKNNKFSHVRTSKHIAMAILSLSGGREDSLLYRISLNSSYGNDHYTHWKVTPTQAQTPCWRCLTKVAQQMHDPSLQ